MTIQRKRRRIRFFRISLRTLLVLMLLSGLACGWVGTMRQRSQRQSHAVTALVELCESRRRAPDLFRPDTYWLHQSPAVVVFDSGYFGRRQPRGQLFPEWLRKIVGEECFHRVIEVYMPGCDIGVEDLDHLQYFRHLTTLILDGATVTDEHVKKIARLDRLEYLCLGGTEITDDAMAEVSRMTQLAELELWYTDLTDAGIADLTSLRKLRRVNLCRTGVTEEGVAQLQQALPNCTIWWDRSKVFRLINSSPTALGRDATNPTHFIRAVNYLHSLGHHRAIESLREYVRVAPGESLSGKSGVYDQSRLWLLIVPVLFEPKKPQKWPYSDYVTVTSDIPFHDKAKGGPSSGPGFPRWDHLVEWLESDCQLRPNCLRPDANPFMAASRLTEMLEEDQEAPFWPVEHLKAQAERMVAHLNLENPEEAKLRWSDERQEYVLAEATASNP